MEENMVLLDTDKNAQLARLADAVNMAIQLTPLIFSGDHTQVAVLVLKEGLALVDELNNKKQSRQEPFAFDAIIPVPSDSKDEDLVWLKNLQNLFEALPSNQRLAARRNLAATQT